jgi:hypothetical protein
MAMMIGADKSVPRGFGFLLSIDALSGFLELKKTIDISSPKSSNK